MKVMSFIAMCCVTAATSVVLGQRASCPLTGTTGVSPVAEKSDWGRFVLPEMGTVNTHALSTGNLYPAIARP